MCYRVTLSVTDKQTDSPVYHPQTQSFPHSPHCLASPKAEGPPGDILVGRQIPAKPGLTGGEQSMVVVPHLGVGGGGRLMVGPGPQLLGHQPRVLQAGEVLGQLVRCQ